MNTIAIEVVETAWRVGHYAALTGKATPPPAATSPFGASHTGAHLNLSKDHVSPRRHADTAAIATPPAIATLASLAASPPIPGRVGVAVLRAAAGGHPTQTGVSTLTTISTIASSTTRSTNAAHGTNQRVLGHYDAAIACNDRYPARVSTGATSAARTTGTARPTV